MQVRHAPLVLVVVLATACSRPDVEGPAVVPAEETSRPVSEPPPKRDPSTPVSEPERPPTGEAASVADPAEVPRSSLARPRHVDPKIPPGLSEFVAGLGQGAWWVGPLAGNGGREVLIYLPGGTSNQDVIELVYHFHGTYSEHVEREAEGVPKKRWVGWNRLQQTVDAVSELADKRDHSVALVYPLSAGKRMEPSWKGWSNKMYDRMWMLPDPPKYTDDFALLHREVIGLLTGPFGVHPELVGRDVVAEGHSAGGIALRNVAASGTAIVKDYLFLDASFQGWADACYRALDEGGVDARVTLVVTDKGIADPWAGRSPWCAEEPGRVEAWKRHRSWCEGQEKPRKAKPEGSDDSCARLREASENWPLQESWCEAAREDFASLEGVRMVRTKVPHGEQPRVFSGRLGLPVEQP